MRTVFSLSKYSRILSFCGIVEYRNHLFSLFRADRPGCTADKATSLFLSNEKNAQAVCVRPL